MKLLETVIFATDIAFPDLITAGASMVEQCRGDNLFMQAGELEILKNSLKSHGISGGLKSLIELAVETGKQYGIETEPTCDAKYLEIGVSSKSTM